VDTYSAERISSLLETERFGRDIEFFEVIDSTQRAAIELAAGGAGEGTLVVAEGQTGGVGRRGRAWHSAPGLGLWFSLVLRPRIPGAAGGLLSAWAGVATLRALERNGVRPGEAGLKWPNDVLIGGRKICGILIDAASASGALRHAVLGVGLNTGHSRADFPPELEYLATSLALETGGSPDRAKVLADLLLELEATYHLAEHAEGRSRLATMAGNASVLVGRRVRVVSEGGLATGRVKGLDDGGGLVLAGSRSGEEKIVLAGDVEVLEFEEDNP
jgi:BirA family biotin operon repressor/biotin-[acetyl-CoA-carboxylase] ligase